MTEKFVVFEVVPTPNQIAFSSKSNRNVTFLVMLLLGDGVWWGTKEVTVKDSFLQVTHSSSHKYDVRRARSAEIFRKLEAGTHEQELRYGN